MDQPSSEGTHRMAVTADAEPECVLEDRPLSLARHRVPVASALATVKTPSAREWLAMRLGLVPNKAPTRSPWRVLSHPELKRYFIGSVASDFGTWIQNTAQALLAYKLTHSALAVGLVICAQFSSPLVLGPWAGVMANRFGSKPILLGTQVLSALFAVALGDLQFTGQLTEPFLIGGASKPIASLVDGLMAGSRIGVRGTGILLAVPTLLPVLILLCWPIAGRRGASAALRPVP